MSLPEAIRGINFFGEIKITGCRLHLKFLVVLRI
jgi:hypothetical protein